MRHPEPAFKQLTNPVEETDESVNQWLKMTQTWTSVLGTVSERQGAPEPAGNWGRLPGVGMTHLTLERQMAKRREKGHSEKRNQNVQQAHGLDEVEGVCRQASTGPEGRGHGKSC